MTATTTPTTRALSRTKKLLLSLTAIGVTASMAGLGSFATFTDTANGSTAIDSGIVDVALGADGTSANRLSVAATDIVPGDSIQRAVQLSTGTSTSELASIKLATSASAANVLTSDATNGLQMLIEKCSVAWTESQTAPYTYTCTNQDGTAGTVTTVLAQRAIIGSDLALSNLTLATNSTNHLRVKVTLPGSADNSFQNLANTVTYAFTGTQRTGTDK